MRRVATVVASDDEHHIDAFVAQLEDGILSLLRRAANRIEGAKARFELALAVAAHHGLPESLRDLERLAAEHGRLVREADMGQVAVGIETGRNSIREMLYEARLVAGCLYVIANPLALVQVTDDEIMRMPFGCP